MNMLTHQKCWVHNNPETTKRIKMPRPKKRSFSIKGHRTSLSLEEPFWNALRVVATEQNMPLATLVAKIDAERGNEDTGLSSAVRIFVLHHFQKQAQRHTPDDTLPSNKISRTDSV